jgi:hypothetical protein
MGRGRKYRVGVGADRSVLSLHRRGGLVPRTSLYVGETATPDLSLPMWRAKAV